MLKRSHFANPILPYLLIIPQMLIVIFFFFWPAGEALLQAFQISDPFGQGSQFVWFDNFKSLFQTPQYREAFAKTLVFSISTASLSLIMGLFLAALTNRILKLKTITRTLLIWPYAVAPAMAGMLWLFIFHPTYGVVGHFLNSTLDMGWNPVLNGTHAMAMVVIAASWKQISYNFVFFLGGLQAIPRSILEAAAIDGAGPIRRFFVIVFPLLSPTIFFLIVMNLVYAFFETFGVIHATTEGGPGGATSTLVYKVYSDGFVGQDLGGSAAQSVVLMIITIVLTIVQFKFVEKKVHYTGG